MPGWEKFRSLKFELLDASMEFFNENEAQILMYLQVYVNKVEGGLRVESLLLSRHTHRWLIRRIFGPGFDPEEHSRYFKPSRDKLEKSNT